MKFSIVIPVYKTKEYLDHCVESVISQTFRDFEIILVDDGSPDCCGAMCDAWAAKDSRIVVVHQENGGLSAARNAGIRRATGEYIMFLDSDDWWADPCVLEDIALRLDKTNADVLSFNYRKVYLNLIDRPYFAKQMGMPDSISADNSLEYMVLNDLWISCAWNKAIRREIMSEHSLEFVLGVTSEDVDWCMRLAVTADRFDYINNVVVMYRQHASSISHSLSPKKVECLCSNVQACVQLLEEAKPEKAELLKPFVAYQYGMLLHNVANLPASQRSRTLMAGVKEMKWLLNCSDNSKVRLLRLSSQFGLPVTFAMLRLRQKLLEHSGKGV